MNQNLPVRKPNRLPEFDYTRNGAYFITICTRDRKPILWNASSETGRPADDDHISRGFVGDGSPVPQETACPQKPPLSPIGEIVRRQITEISAHFPSATVERFAIMPDHIHLILFLHRDFGTGDPSPTMGNVVGWLKYQTTKTVNAEKGTFGETMWQRSYYDHVIRNEKDYIETMQYIDNNPVKRTFR